MKTVLSFFSLFLIFNPIMGHAAFDSQACEDARNKLLAPARQAKIKECKKDSKNDPAWCESYYADYGNATYAGGGKMNKRKYDDIPECK
jgi:hypothetical protein